MRMKKALLVACVSVAAIMVSGCSLVNAIAGILSPPPPPVPVPGNIATLAIDLYACDPLDNSVGGSFDFSTRLGLYGWNNVYQRQNLFVVPGDMITPDSSVDALLFDGHGFPGLVVLADNCFNMDQTNSWGVGNTLGRFGAGPTPRLTPPNKFGMPIGGRLKWLFLNSSDSGAGPTIVDSNPNDSMWTANWLPAFSGSLHGIYGFWQGPATATSCTDPVFPSRVCDLDENGAAAVDDALPALLYDPFNRTDVHDAWVNASNNANEGSKWTIWEDSAARLDSFSGPGANPPYTRNLSGSILFYYPQNVLGISTASVIVQPQTFTVQPLALINEPIDDVGLTNQYRSQLVGTNISSSGGQYVVENANAKVVHYTAASGAVIYSNRANDNPVAFSQAAGQAYAESYIKGTFGMPPDAVLRAVLSIWKVYMKDGSAIRVGYEYIYGHQSAMVGGDAIKVIVDDYHYVTSKTCLYINPCTGQCTDWKYTYADEPQVDYAYRLWRSLGAKMQTAGAGSQSVTAQAAAQALPQGAIINSYASGYWTPPYSASSAAGATPAWIFYLSGGTTVAVDALTGTFLGMTNDE